VWYSKIYHYIHSTNKGSHYLNNNNFNCSKQHSNRLINNYYSPLNLDIYTEIEATYKASLLKKKARTYNTEDALAEFHKKAKITIETLTKNMILGETSLEKLFEHYREIKREIVIKMLIRCKKMYIARADVKKILL
jgi:hypothetical protein